MTDHERILILGRALRAIIEWDTNPQGEERHGIPNDVKLCRCDYDQKKYIQKLASDAIEAARYF